MSGTRSQVASLLCLPRPAAARHPRAGVGVASVRDLALRTAEEVAAGRHTASVRHSFECPCGIVRECKHPGS